MRKKTLPFILQLVFTGNLIMCTNQLYSARITTIVVAFNAVFRPDQSLIAGYIRSKLRFRNYISLIFKGIPKSDVIKKELFDFLHTVPRVPDLPEPHNYDAHYFPYEMEGTAFPPIFRQMFVTQKSEDEQKIVQQIVYHLHNNSGISSQTRRVIMQAIVETIFQTHLMNQFVQPNSFMLALLNNLQQQGYRLILIGNVPGYAWKKLLLECPQSAPLKSLFDEQHRFISGERILLSTSPELYEIMINQHDLDAAECLVIESTLNNTRCAQRYGMSCITFNEKKDNFQKFKQKVLNILA